MTETETKPITREQFKEFIQHVNKVTKIVDIRTRYFKWRIDILENMILTLSIAFAVWILYEFGVFDLMIGDGLNWSS
jgi:hypothetical protein